MENLFITLQQSQDSIAHELHEIHYHKEYEFIFVTKGTVTMEINSSIYEANSPSVIIVSPLETHQIINATDDYQRIVLVLNASEFENNIPPKICAVLKCRPKGFKSVLYPAQKEFNRILNCLSELQCENITYYNDYVRNLIHNLMILICRLEPQSLFKNKEMMEIQTYIDKNYAEIDSLQEVAEKFFISNSHFSRAFKEYSGYSPIQYLMNIRIYKSQELLLNTNMRVNEISNMVGYKDNNNFIKQFKAKLGLTPNSYRNENANEFRNGEV